MKTALIFARMDSRRLPGKVLADIAGRPMLDRVLDRVARTDAIGRMVVATSTRDVDDPIATHAAARGVAVFRGAAEDVAGRALACCAAQGLDAFVRISGDSPFIAPEVIDAVCALFDAEAPDLATNVYPRSFPAGCSVEVIDAAALDRAARQADDADREHVTTRFYCNPQAFRIANLAAADSCADIRMTVDTEAELAQARWIAAQAGGRPEALPLERVVSLARAYAAEMPEARR